MTGIDRLSQQRRRVGAALAMASTPRPPVHVLVIDDEADVRELIVDFFREVGYEVSAAADGAAAVDDISRNPSKYGLVISDLQLPGLDGLEVLKAAKAANPALPVIIVTGHATADSAVRAVRLGAYDYLTKPFTLGQLETIVTRAINRAALDAANRQPPTAGGIDALRDRIQALEARLDRLERTLAATVRQPTAGSPRSTT